MLHDFRSQAADDDDGEFRAAVSGEVLRRPSARKSSCRGCRSGRLPDRRYDEVTFSLQAGEVYVFCTDGVFEAMNELGQEFTAARLLDVVGRSRELPAAKIVAAIFQAVGEWRGDAAPNDDMTAVVVASLRGPDRTA